MRRAARRERRGSESIRLLIAVALVAATAQTQPRARRLENLNLAPAAGGITATVEADGSFEHRLYLLDDPSRVVVDVLDVRNPLPGMAPDEPHPLLRHVLSQQLSMTAYDESAVGRTFARLVFEMKRPVIHSIRDDPGRFQIQFRSADEPTSDGVDTSAAPTANGNGVDAMAGRGPATDPESGAGSAIETEEDDVTPEDGDGRYPSEFSIEPAGVAPAVFFGPISETRSQYTIGPDDMLEIRVFELDQLNRTVRVEADGTILLPLVGPVPVSGLSAPQAADAVAGKLRGEFVDDPQVTVLITEYLSSRVSLLGAVARPGAYPLVGERGILEVLASAEGLTPEAGSVLYIFRTLDQGTSARLAVPLHELLILGDPRWNVRLRPGDVVSVPPEGAISVSVVGSVAKPGVYKLPAGRGATLLRAIALAGGLLPRASKDIQVKRPGSAGSDETLKVDLDAIMSGKSSDFVLLEGDVVIVRQSFF